MRLWLRYIAFVLVTLNYDKRQEALPCRALYFFKQIILITISNSNLQFVCVLDGMNCHWVEMFLLIFTDYEWFIYAVTCKDELLAGP